MKEDSGKFPWGLFLECDLCYNSGQADGLKDRLMENIMEIEKVYEELNEKLADAERVLVGLGAEWKLKDEERETKVQEAKKKLKSLL